MTEFRKYGRSPLPGKVKLKHRELGEFYLEGGDISAAGVFLKIQDDRPLAIGDELAVELPDGGTVAQQTGTWSKVVRVTRDGIGLMFL